MNNINITAVRLRRTRRLKGMTQQELADKVGLSKSTISKYEKGSIVNIKKNVLYKMASALGVSYAYLLDVNMPSFYSKDIDSEVETMLKAKIYEYLDNYESLNEQGQQALDKHINAFLQYV